MGRYLFLFVIVFVVVFIVQQSHLFVGEKVMDTRIGVYRDEVRVQPKNLQEYLQDIPKKIETFFRRHQRSK